MALESLRERGGLVKMREEIWLKENLGPCTLVMCDAKAVKSDAK